MGPLTSGLCRGNCRLMAHFFEVNMIYRAKTILSDKLLKQLKALERKPEAISFAQTLDAVADRVNARPIVRRRRG